MTDAKANSSMETVCANEDFCKGCGNFDGFWNSCKLAMYESSIQGKRVWIAPRTNDTRWLLAIVGCASDTRRQSSNGTDKKLNEFCQFVIQEIDSDHPWEDSLKEIRKKAQLLSNCKKPRKSRKEAQ